MGPEGRTIWMNILFCGFAKPRRVMLGALLLASLGIANAQSAGFDLFQTLPGTAADLKAAGLGVVRLKGVPIPGVAGNTDTIIHRTQDVPKGGGPVHVVVYALSMKSEHPITFHKQLADVFVTINNSGGAISQNALPQPDHLPESSGTVVVRTNGTFDSKIMVHADLIFVRAGTSPENEKNILHHQPATPVQVASSNSKWSSTPPADRVASPPAYPSGSFFGFPNHGKHPTRYATPIKNP